MTFKSPRQLFLSLWLGLYIIFALYETLHRFAGFFDPGTIFLTQLIALFSTTIATLAYPRWRHSKFQWTAASIVAVLIVVFSIIKFNNTKSGDSGATIDIHYSCVDGESDGSVISVLGDSYSSSTEEAKGFICVIKNLPLAASGTNLNDQTVEVFVFFAYELILIASFMEARYINNR